MRRAAIVLVALALCAPFAGGASARGRCSGRLPRAPAGLPAPVTITTACGRFRIGRDGRITRSPNPLPVPRGVAWYPTDDSWYTIEHGHLVVGRGHRRLWRSQGRFAPAYDVGALTIGPHTLAFSYGRSPRLFVAGFGSAEREVADREYPLGWTRRGDLFTHTSGGGRLRLRHAGGDLAGTLPGKVLVYTFDHANREVVFVRNGHVLRTDGTATTTLADLARLGLSRRPELDPLARLLVLRDHRRIVVLRRHGSLLASAPIPPRRSRMDGISSAFAAAPDGHSIAFAATRTLHGSLGTESIYLLRGGMRRAAPVHTERLRFAICGRGAELAWHGRWLLYSASEGKVVVLDSTRRRQALELTRIALRLPGSHGGEGHANVDARWG